MLMGNQGVLLPLFPYNGLQGSSLLQQSDQAQKPPWTDAVAQLESALAVHGVPFAGAANYGAGQPAPQQLQGVSLGAPMGQPNMLYTYLAQQQQQQRNQNASFGDLARVAAGCIPQQSSVSNTATGFALPSQPSTGATHEQVVGSLAVACGATAGAAATAVSVAATASAADGGQTGPTHSVAADPASSIPHASGSALASRDVEGLLCDAHDAYRRADYSKALQLCQAAHAVHPTRTDLLLLMGAIHYQLGAYDKCIVLNDSCICLDPSMAEAHANLANALQQLGNFDMAIIYYQAALRLKPDFTDAYNNMASALVQKGAVPQAIECYNAALRINSHLVDVYNNLGDLWRAQGPLGRSAAQQCYSEALRVDKTYASAWHGLGDLYREGGDHVQAVACYQEAARLKPGFADALTSMGVSLKELKRREEAEACFREVVRLRPHCALSLGNLAGVYYEQGKLDLAVMTYKEALTREPNFPEAYNNLGNALREAGKVDEAVACYTMCIQLQLARPATPAAARAAALNPAAAAAQQSQRLSVAYNNLGGILKMQGRAAEAITCYEHVAQLQPEAPEAHANLASSYKDAAKHDVAIASYQRAMQLRPDFPEAFANLVHSLQCVCDWRDRDAAFVRLELEVRRDLQAGRLPPVQPFHAMAYPFPADLALAISQKYAEYCALQAARLGMPALPHPPARPLGPGQRLRVGYVSSDFGNHPLSHLMGSVFGLHDRSRVEVFCYALSPSDRSEWRLRIEAEAEHFLDVSAWPATEIARRISADGVQVAINLNGYTKGARNEVFALLPAPVQASYMGFPATAGARFLPYLIIDKVVAPPESRHCYSENLAYMPHCYFVNDYKAAHRDVLDEATLPARSEIGLPEGKIIYSCSNQLYKYDPETFDTWCRILRRVPDSVLWLLRFPPYGEPRIKQRALSRGVDPSRVIFTDVANKPEHIRRSGVADVFLDTPLCNAHTTGCDVLWAGCPMVTLPLERMASRVAASLCHAAGFPEMVVSSQAEYEEMAVELGTNHARRLALRERLKAARLSSPLFDTRRWVRDLERVYLRMWDIHCEGCGPRDFAIED